MYDSQLILTLSLFALFTIMPRDTYLKKVLGDRYQDLKDTTVLMVGAGGIGCELLKNLLLSGVGNIHVVDLDTITLSNLNRQFLFRHKDIDKSKSLTIKNAVQSFNYHNTQITAHHGNIMDTDQFPISFWKQFKCIYNALDNLEARRYVNRMALFLKTPVMESGTTGFDGYVQPIIPYQTECFDCQAKVTPQVFPVCTIRSTPSKPVHCITWAKEFLFQQLISGEAQDQSNEDIDFKEVTDNEKERENLVKEHNELKDLKKSLLTKTHNEFFHEMVQKLWVIDIERLLLIDTLWTNRKKPTALTSLEIAESIPNDETKAWSVAENLKLLYEATKKIQSRLLVEKSIEFDKDDEDTLNFVVAASNLRSFVFHIDILSKFDCKQIAGNIIPAIATTNAIISGFSAVGALNFYKPEPKDNASMVFISIRPNKYATAASLESPKPTCPSCSVSRGIASIPNSLTIQQLVDSAKEKYQYPGDISLIYGKSRLLYDYDFTDNADKTLADLAIKNGEFLLISDEEEELGNLELYIHYDEKFELPRVKLQQSRQQFKEDPEKIQQSQHEPLLDQGNGFDPIVIEDEDEDENEKTETGDVNKQIQTSNELQLEEIEDVTEPVQKKQKL